ncbi:S8 family serine peptidase [Cohnella sp.]|uniref:S8 family peptidase n=1 Tax=Cohnella sp. TaxID=1883426 RepID=UPI003569B0AF
MNALAKQLCQSARSKPSLQTERRIIVLRQDKDYRHCLKELQAAGIKPVKTDSSLRLICCHTDRRLSWQRLIDHPRVAYVERDHKVKAHGLLRMKAKSTAGIARIPWNINRVKAPPVWKASNSGAGVKVAIIDTGIARHPDLRIAGGVNTLGGRSFADDNGHGTHVAGIAAAKGNKKIYGTAPRVRLYAVKVLDASGSGFITDIVEGIEWCLSRGIKIMNMSFGLVGESKALRDAVRRARRRGAVMVASAGNNGRLFTQIEAPARYPETLAVAAVSRGNRVAAFSSRGKGIDLSAPGINIYSTWLKGTYRRESGTSMSSPHVTGAAALLRAIKPGLSATEVSRKLTKSALRIPGGIRAVGQGLLQVSTAARTLSNKRRK